jgi:hypothetical protein
VNELVHRCTVCGHLSRAKKKPSSHDRFIPTIVRADEWVAVQVPARSIAEALPEGRTHWDAAAEARELGLRIFRVYEPSDGTTYDYGDPAGGDMGGPDYDWHNPGGVKVRCGPFETFQLAPVVAGFKYKAARDLQVGDSVCSLGIVAKRDDADEDGHIEVSFDPDGPVGTAAWSSTGLSPRRSPTLTWHEDYPVVVLVRP